jgi:phage terminase large subunit GpA-like protein
MSSALDRIVRNALSGFAPPPKMSLSQWAEEYAYLSAESSAEPGKWRNLPYQVGIMDAITDPRVERVTVMKSARVGYTKIIGHAISYYIHFDPCPIMVVQPTESDAEGYSKEEIAPMIRDTPVIANLVKDSKSRDSGNTILQKQFPGGSLSLVGANSPRGFRRVSRRVVIFDEVDGYPPAAGAEGDQIKLGIRRTEYYWNRKIIAGSTPTTSRLSRIEPMFLESDQRFLHVPCPTCRSFQVLKFASLKWPKGNPERAYFVCEYCRQPIDHRDKRSMIEAGKWIAEREFNGHAGFHLWAGYSFSPNATWGHLAKEFLEANRGGEESLKTYVNTVLGETWKDKAETPDSKRLWERRESYPLNTIPQQVVFLTCGVDVQKNRIEFEIVGWTRNKESYSIDYRVIEGDTATKEPWMKLSEVLSESWTHPSGVEFGIMMMAVDTGYNTQHVYNWIREQSPARVMAIKGTDSSVAIVGHPTFVDVSFGGKTIKRGVQLWKLGTSLAKQELYAWLKLPMPSEGLPFPAGYCHFPEYDEGYFEQLTAEQLVTKLVRGYQQHVWEKIRERNEALDCRIYARAAAARVGLDRFTEQQWDELSAELAATPQPKDQTVKEAEASSGSAKARNYWRGRRR